MLVFEAGRGEFCLSVGHFAGRHFFYGYADYWAGVCCSGLKNYILKPGAGKFAGEVFGVFFCAEGAKLDIPVGAGGEVYGLFCRL